MACIDLADRRKRPGSSTARSATQATGSPSRSQVPRSRLATRWWASCLRATGKEIPPVFGAFFSNRVR